MELEVLTDLNTIRTSRFTYDLTTGEIILRSGRRVSLTVGGQHDLVLRAIHASAKSFLSNTEIAQAAKSHSSKSKKEVGKQLIGEISEKLEITANSDDDIFKRIRSQGYGLIE